MFGQKDFQQVAIIKKMVQKLNLDVEIVPVAIMRESDGLAMSSRNTLLEYKYREIAGEIFKTAGEIASELGLDSYRTNVNTGAGAGQSVFHAHLHLLGGRSFAWPPG
mgnify:CR=1 FL=1